jgi:branched-subunit amino acid ABC-type transport system permease component
MRDLLPFLVVGLTSGSVFSLAALGLVVTYKTSGVFNFAHGAAGMIATYVFYSLRQDAGVPAAIAIPLVVLVLAPIIGFLIDRLILRRLSGAPPAAYVVASLGLLVALQGIGIVIWGAASRRIDPYLPTSTFRLPGVNVGWDQAIVVLVAAASALALIAFFQTTRLGLWTRAVVDDDVLCELMGVDSRAVTTLSWMLGTSFAALSGILLAPFVGLDVVILTLLVVQAFGAAAVARLTSLPLTYAGGVLIGVGAAVSTKFVADYPVLAGFPASLPFIVLFAVLVGSRKGRFTEITKVRARPGNAVRYTGRATRYLPFLAVAVVVPFTLSGSRVLTATATLAFVLVFASLGLLVGLSRQVSLSHAVFVGLGATTMSHLLDAGLPFLVALVLAGLILVPVGALVAIPAIRLSGLFLALATFGFGVLAQSLVFSTTWGFGGDGTVVLPRPSFLGIDFNGDRAFYFLVLGVVAAGVTVMEVVKRTRLGRVLRALADSPTAVESIGIRPTVSRVLVFSLASFLAAVSGGLLGSLFRSVNTVSFDFSQSLIWLSVLVTTGAATLGGAVLAAVLFVAVPATITASAVTEYQPVFFGVAAMLLAQAPNGLVGLLRAALRRRPDFSRLAERSAWRTQRSPRAARLAGQPR